MTDLDHAFLHRARHYPREIFDREISDPSTQAAIANLILSRPPEPTSDGSNVFVLGQDGLIAQHRSQTADMLRPVVTDAELLESTDPAVFLEVDMSPRSCWRSPDLPVILVGEDRAFSPRGAQWIAVDPRAEARAAREDLARRVEAELARREARQSAIDAAVREVEAKRVAGEMAAARAAVERDIVGAIVELQRRAGLRAEDGQRLEPAEPAPTVPPTLALRRAELYFGSFTARQTALESTAAVLHEWEHEGAPLVAPLGTHPVAEKIRACFRHLFVHRYDGRPIAAPVVAFVEIDGVRHVVRRLPFGPIATPV